MWSNVDDVDFNKSGSVILKCGGKGRAGPSFYEGVIIKTHSLCTLLTSSNLILFFMRRREGPLALENMMASNSLPELHILI